MSTYTEAHKRYYKKKGKEIRDNRTKVYYVYYIPSVHYCGVTNHLSVRMSQHKTVEGIDTEGWRVLYASKDPKEAAYHEALFQSVLAIEGVNYKSKNKLQTL